MSELHGTGEFATLSKPKTGRGDPLRQFEALQERIRQLEAENRRLYEQCFVLHEQLSDTNIHERERMQFVANLAHELRNPLTSIKGYLDLLLDGAVGDMSPLQQEFIATAGANANRLSQIINELLDISRFERGLISFNPQLFDLKALVMVASEDSRPLFSAKEIEFKLNLPPNGKIEVQADKERFLQALRAVLANSGRNCTKGETVWLDLYSDPASKQAVIAISDNGATIPAADLSKIFTKFFQSDDPTWHDKGNFGLGLAIAKAVIEMHSGAIIATNRPEGGNIFNVLLPLANYPGEVETVKPPQRAALLLSDSPLFGEMVQKVLSEGGFQVVVAERHEEVVSDSMAWIPDVVIQQGSGVSPIQISRTLPTLELDLSELEQKAILQGALAVLPYPANESLLAEQLVQAVAPNLSPDQLVQFKQTQPILLVSPINETLRNLDKFLRESGHLRVYRATMEYDALTLAHRYQPSLLLVDLTVTGGMAEVTLLEDLKNDPLLSNTPTIVFAPLKFIVESSAPRYQSESTTKRKLANRKINTGELTLGAYTNYVPKPFIKNVFLSLVDRLAKGVY
jgi:signal transduction histidine kinase/CheY-like chemotaxis protein